MFLPLAVNPNSSNTRKIIFSVSKMTAKSFPLRDLFILIHANHNFVYQQTFLLANGRLLKFCHGV